MMRFSSIYAVFTRKIQSTLTFRLCFKRPIRPNPLYLTNNKHLLTNDICSTTVKLLITLEAIYETKLNNISTDSDCAHRHRRFCPFALGTSSRGQECARHALSDL